jgi:hypothetical protein
MLSLMLLPQLSFAYGAEAHAIIGHVAERFLCTDARKALMDMDSDYSLAEAGVWADRIRSNADWDIARPWHYINVPDGVGLSEAKRRAAGDILSALARFQVELADESLPAQQRLEAFYFVVHFVADLHQPLHVGRRSDLGGNKVDIRVNGRNSNLHSYLDRHVLDGVLRSPVGYAGRLAARNRLFVTRWQATGPSVWAVESQAFRREVYDFGQPKHKGRYILSPAYQVRALEITEFRMAQAGIRLAGVLNEIWCPTE